MTIETTVSKTIQSGNGSNKGFDFAFEIPDEDSLSLTKRGSDGTETAITTNYTVTGIGDEAGGTVNYPTSGSALTSQEKIIIKRVISLKQNENLRNQGDYSLEDIEDALDRAVMMCQQLQEQIDRCLKLNLTSSSRYVNVDDFIANRLLVVSSDGQSIEMSSAEYGSIDAYLSTLAGIATAVSTVASISANVSTLAGISSAVSNVSSISSAVSTVSGISSAVSTVASISSAVSSVSSNATNINTVAGIATAVSTVASISANVSTLAGISSNVTTVADMSASIASVVANMTSIQNAASFGFPTLASGDEYKILQIKADRSGYNAVEAISRKNAIINGDFNVWQRGTSFSSIASATYFADRFFYQKSGAMVHDVSRSTDVPTVSQAGRLFNYSALVDCTTVDSSISAGDHCFIAQRIEGFNWLFLAQKIITLSFWVKAPKTGIYCVALRNNLAGTPDRSYVAEYTINAADTWEYKTITITASPSAGTWDYTTGTGAELAFVLACGSTYQTSAGSWVTGNYIATSNQVNACDNTANNFRICGVQLEIGSLPTFFESKTFGEELRLCQRYYTKTFPYATAPAQNVASSTGALLFRNNSTVNNCNFGVLWQLPVRMRSAPTVTTYNPFAANSSWRDLDNSTDKSVVTYSAENLIQVEHQGTSLPAYVLAAIHAAASSEL